ncbi:MAG: hypothetical protein ACM336_00865 [Acidobacteriota bacterium]
MFSRRRFLGAGAALGALATSRTARADVPDHLWAGYDFGPGPAITDRLNQGPFPVEQDDGWLTIATTTQSAKPVRNFGMGLCGYTWEESGPSLPARAGRQTLENHVEQMASLPFVDVLYIRCDWRDVQKQPGRLDLHPVWKLTFDAAKTYGKRVGFRVMLSNTVGQPQQLAMPDFVQQKVPIVTIGRSREHGGGIEFREPRYEHPEFLKAFRELNELLAREFDGHPQAEFMDLIMYGFWGEGHTNDVKNPFPDYLTAERTMAHITQLQLDAWKRTPLAVNTEPDISQVGNREVQDMCVRAGCWLRSDSILQIEEPLQIEMLANRPPWLAVVMEDGGLREYDVNKIPLDNAGVNLREKAMLHVLDLGANYWSLWTEGDNLKRYNERYPRGFATLQQRMGYRVRPSWVWQRKRYGTSEVIVGVTNDGVAGVPGALRLSLESLDGKFKMSGSLDAGHPHGGRLRLGSFLLPKGMEGQRLKLRAEIETKGVRRPVNWACEQPLEADGSFAIRIARFDAKGWRKGV